MIEVTRLNDTKILINPDLIEFVEETPDTVITFTTGRKIIVKEFPERRSPYNRRRTQYPHRFRQTLPSLR